MCIRPTHSDPTVIHYFTCFGDGRYEDCIALGSRLLKNPPQDVIFQLNMVFMLALQQIGALETLAALAKLINFKIAGEPWFPALKNLAVGKTPFERVLSQAETPVQRCQTHYYHGAREFARGNRESARKHFETCIELRTSCWEQWFAKCGLKQLDDIARDARPSPYMGLQRAFQACYESFASRDYARCAEI